mgnify:CR=1 FL=1
MDLLIFADVISPRIEYVFNHVFTNQLGLKYKITTQINEFNASDQPKLSYAKQKVTNGIFLKAHSILFETDIVKQDINMSVYKKKPIFFTSKNVESILPFDPFATITPFSLYNFIVIVENFLPTVTTVCSVQWLLVMPHLTASA